MIIHLSECLKCPWFYYCHKTNFQDRPCKDKQKKAEQLEIVDQDELQLRDELNTEWVEAWKRASGEVYFAQDLQTGKIIAFKIPVSPKSYKTCNGENTNEIP